MAKIILIIMAELIND